MNSGGIIIILLPIIIFVLLLVIKIKFYHSNWNVLIDNFKYSTVDFYKLFKEELKETKVKGISYKNVNLHQGIEFVSLKNRYLRAEWKKYRFDLCAAPFGRGMFFSWWVVYKVPVLFVFIYIIPFIGPSLARFSFPFTYYKYDSATMFMKYAHLATLSVVDSITTENGVRILTEDERKPMIRVFNDIMKR